MSRQNWAKLGFVTNRRAKARKKAWRRTSGMAPPVVWRKASVRMCWWWWDAQPHCLSLVNSIAMCSQSNLPFLRGTWGWKKTMERRKKTKRRRKKTILIPGWLLPFTSPLSGFCWSRPSTNFCRMCCPLSALRSWSEFRIQLQFECAQKNWTGSLLTKLRYSICIFIYLFVFD